MKTLSSMTVTALFTSAIFLMGVIMNLNADETKPSVTKSVFGQTGDGANVDLYTLTNSAGLEAQIMTYGATLISVKTPDKEGKIENITLRLDTFEDYEKGHPLFGSIVGRFANRIAGAKFTLDGIEYPLEANAVQNHIHGGKNGFQKLIWDATVIEEGKAAVAFSLVSPDGDAGYPGKLKTTVTYELTEKNELVLDYRAETDKPTHLNLTNHMYWNLSGAGSGEVFDQVLKIYADFYLPGDEGNMPTGEIAAVQGTPMDFRKPQTIGSRIKEVPGDNYDNTYIVNKNEAGELALSAEAYDPKSGRRMTLYTTQPGFQLYTAKHLNSRYQWKGTPYGPYHGFCMETQRFPNTPQFNYFPSTVLRPGETFHEKTVFQFEVK